jgi:hypothetical protein
VNRASSFPLVRGRIVPLSRWPRRRSSRLLLESLETRQLLSVSSLAPNPIAVPSSAGATPLAAQAIPAALTASQVRQAYGLNQISFNGGTIGGNGAGQTIAIITAYDDPNIGLDLSHFDSQMGLSAPPSFTKYLQGGLTQSSADWSLETSLDVEWAHAMAPGANLVLVEAKSASVADLFSAVDFARSLNGVVAVSMSWGTPEFYGETSFDSLFTTPAGHIGGSNLPGGVTFIASSGDTGAWSGVSYPAASPNVLSVGATALTLGTGSGYGAETGWGGSTGGFSAFESAPAYQGGAQGVSGLTRGMRTVPDVAAVGSPATGVAVYDSVPYAGHSGWYAVGGTSASAPQWAGLIAVADQGLALAGIGSLGSAQAALYSIPTSAFHDVTAGFNGYSATAGYDLVSGLGTPIANRVVTDLLAAQPYGVLGLPPVAPTSAIHQGPLNASFVLSAGGSGGTSSTTGSTSSPTSTTSLFPVNIVVIIVPVGSGEIIVIVAAAPVAPSPFASTSHYVESQSAIAPTEPGSSANTLSVLAKFGQGPAIGLPLPLYQRINPKDEIPSLIDLILPLPGAAPKAAARPAARADLPERMLTFPELSLSVFSAIDHDQTRQEVWRAESPRPAAVGAPPFQKGRGDREEEEAPTSNTSSTLAGVAAIAVGGLWMSLRESERRKQSWIPGRFDSPRLPAGWRTGNSLSPEPWRR